MTFSIVARSDDGESWGVAVASKFLAVGSAVPAAVAQVGAIATQADANVAYKGLALAHLDDGATASVALTRLLEEDEGRDHRQVGIVDVDGGSATHTGQACIDWAGGESGEARRHSEDEDGDGPGGEQAEEGSDVRPHVAAQQTEQDDHRQGGHEGRGHDAAQGCVGLVPGHRVGLPGGTIRDEERSWDRPARRGAVRVRPAPR